MLTLADISLAALRIVNPENIATGSATAGTTTSLTDTDNLTQPQQHFDRGILWIRSGTHIGKVLMVTGHSAAKLTFAALGSAISAGDRYAVARNLYPWQQIRNAIMDALWETHIESTDETLIGDGTTLEFTLPSGAWDVKRVVIKHPTDTSGLYDSISNHWRETNGKLKFDYGYAPDDDYKIAVTYRDQHAELTNATDEVNGEINYDWLKYKTAEYLLNWAMGKYGAQAEYRIEERMNMVMEKLKKLSPRINTAPDIRIRNAGG